MVGAGGLSAGLGLQAPDGPVQAGFGVRQALWALPGCTHSVDSCSVAEKPQLDPQREEPCHSAQGRGLLEGGLAWPSSAAAPLS